MSYRNLAFGMPTTNLANAVTIAGMFAINSTTGATGAITRPSQGSGAATGQGNLFTVTQPTANKFLWQVKLTEQYYKPVLTWARLTMVPTAGNAGTGVKPGSAFTAPTAPSANVLDNAGTNTVSAFSTGVDVPASTGSTDGSNTFYIFLSGAAGVIPTAGLTVPAGYTLFVEFEAEFINAVSPTTL